MKPEKSNASLLHGVYNNGEGGKIMEKLSKGEQDLINSILETQEMLIQQINDQDETINELIEQLEIKDEIIESILEESTPDTSKLVQENQRLRQNILLMEELHGWLDNGAEENE